MTDDGSSPSSRLSPEARRLLDEQLATQDAADSALIARAKARVLAWAYSAR